MMAGQVGDVGICGIVWNNVIIVTALLSPEPPREVRGASASAGAGGDRCWPEYSYAEWWKYVR